MAETEELEEDKATGDFSLDAAAVKLRVEFLLESTSLMLENVTPGGGGGGDGVVVVDVDLDLCPWTRPRTSPTKTIFIMIIYLLLEIAG